MEEVEVQGDKILGDETQETQDANPLDKEDSERREEAYKELLDICAAQNVAIPESLRQVIDGNDEEKKEEDNDDNHENVSLLQSYLNQRQSEVEEEDEVFAEIRKLWESLKIGQRLFNVVVKDGSYTVTNTVETDFGNTAKKGADADEEEGGPPKRAKQKVQTVKNQSPTYKLRKALEKMIRKRTCDIRPEKVQKTLLDGINLKFESPKLYLVLGAPGAGKSTLLRYIANTLRVDKENVRGGDVWANGIKLGEKGVVWQNLTAYIDQIDRLHKYLTVLETCNFAWRCKSGGTHAKGAVFQHAPERAEIAKQMDEDNFIVSTTLKAMGLSRVQDTFVGDNETVRGVSGGEKKRVTVSEMMVIGVPILLMDEISTGLDAATTYDIVKLFGAVSRLTGGLKIISLLQPPPETVALFDELVLVDSGRVIYFGPVASVVPYFESLGYKCPERMDAADWLQALPTKDGANYLVDKEMKHMTTEEFEEKFKNSERGKSVMEDVEQPVEEDTELLNSVAKTTYKHNSWGFLKLLMGRETLLWWRDKYSIRARIMQDLLMAIIAGTLFWQQWDNPQSVMGILFQSMFFISLGAMLKIPEQFELRGVLYKHQDAKLFPTWAFVVARSLAMIPTGLTDAIVYGTIVYFFVGLAHNDGATIANYFVFLLLTLAISISASLLFSVFSAVVKDRPTSQAAMSITLIFLVLFSGFTVQPDIIPDYWIWVYWSNLYAWILRSLVLNEYRSGKYPEEYADNVLTTFGFTLNGEPFTKEWIWYGLVFAIGLSILSVLASTFFLRVIRFDTGATLATEIEDDDGEAEEIEEISIPFQKVNLTFKDIHYTVTASTSDEKLELLKGIDGYLEAGKMTALMGSSGAGKTTLMDVLSLRKSSGEITGEVRLNGHLQEPQSFRRCTGYVEQFDVQSAQLTIRETVEFSAALRLEEKEVTPEMRKKFVDQTLAMLELTAIQDLQVGSDLLGGLSFEQNKRLSIAVELVANPSIIFLDEPTSGLDARAAGIVMRGLRRITDGGRAVCATIHQPSIAIFSGFDSLLLLKRGGETVFFGSLGEESVNLINYLQWYPSTKKIRPGENPATWMLTTIGAGSSTTGAKPFDYAGAFAGSKLREQALSEIEAFDATASSENQISFPTKYATSWKTQMRKVCRRTMTVYWRTPTYNLARMMVAVIVALLFGSVYVSQRTPETESDMNSRVTTIFITTIFISVAAYNTVLSVYEAERNMFYRHKAALMYDQKPILVAFTLAEIPFLLLACMLFVVPFYFMMGFATEAYKFFIYYAIFLLNTTLFCYLGHMMVSLTRTSQVAQGFGAVFIGLTSLFSGLLIRPQDINGFWVFAYWLMPGHYVLEALLTSQFRNDDTPIIPSPGSPFYTAVCGEDNPDCDETGTAEQWIFVSFGGMFLYDHLWYDFLYLVGAILIVKIITWIALTKLNYLTK